MRTIIIIIIGLAVMGLAMWFTNPHRRFATALLFTGLWLLVTLWNLYTGMSHGYSLREEFPFQATIFAVPVLAAWWLACETRGH